MNRAIHSFWRNFTKAVSGQVAATAFTTLAFVINARALGISDLGTLLLVTAVCDLTSKFFSFQSWQAVVKFGAIYRGVEDQPSFRSLWWSCFWLDQFGVGLAAVGTTVFLLNFHEIVSVPLEILPEALFFALCIVLTGSSASIGALRVMDSFGTVVAIQVWGAAALFGTALSLSILNEPLPNYLILIGLVSGLPTVITNIAAFRMIRKIEAGALERSTNSMRAPLRFALGMSLSGSLNALRQRSEVLIIGALLGPSSAALFGTAYRISALTSRVADAGRQAIYPEISNLISRNSLEEARRTTGYLSLKAILLSCAGAFAVIVAGRPGLTFLFGDEFSDAYPNLILLTVSALAMLCIVPVSTLLQIYLGSRSFLYMNAYASVAFLVGAIIGPILFGSPGAGLGSLSFALAFTVIVMYQSRVMSKRRNDDKP